MRRALSALWLTAALGVSLDSPALAQPDRPVGVPVAGGVPFDSNPPDWLSATPAYGKTVNDPRWRGAVSVTHGASGAASPAAEFRALHKGGFLYLSWVVKEDPLVVSGADQLYVGFSLPEGNGNTRAVLAVVTVNSTAATAATDQSRTIECFSGTAAEIAANNNQWPSRPVPPWLANNTAVWSSSADRTWAIHMKIPLVTGPLAGKTFPADGIPVDGNNNFRMWFEYLNVIGLDPDPAGNPPAEPMSYPRDTFFTTPGGNLLIPDIATRWANFHLNQGAGDMTLVRQDGITLSGSDVGVKKNGVLGHLMEVSSAGDRDNVFAAKVNNGGPPVALGEVKARFRIANWGSTLGTPLPGEELWTPLPLVPPEPANGGPIATGGSAELTGTWTARPADPLVAKFLSGERSAHQCVLVELTSNNANLFFVNTSVYRNMDFVKASKFERVCMINIDGLPPVRPDAKTRDVYLFVRTRAMPPSVFAPAPPPEPWPVAFPKIPGPRSVPTSAPPRDPGPKIGLREIEPGLRFVAAAQPRPRQPQGDGVTVPPPAEPKPEVPTYTVYAWHDTGETLTVNGLNLKVVKSQTSFGYFVSHDGPLYGWQHALKGARKLGPDFYKVSPPTGGSVNVVTEIEAIETGPCVPQCVCPPWQGPIVITPCPCPPQRRGLLFRRWR